MIKKKKILGVLGGMGPLASTAFLKSIYSYNTGSNDEQLYPDVILYSISSIPDRTKSFINNNDDLFFERLLHNLEVLNNTGVDKIVVCCNTSHYVFSRLPSHILNKIISLIDLSAHELIKKREPSLLLATLGAYQKNLFKNSDLCKKAEQYIIVPEDDDKERIHDIIYKKLKKGDNIESVYVEVKDLLKKHNTKSFIAGCTEFHFLVEHILLKESSDISFIDPLITIAKNLDDFLEGRYEYK